MKGLILTLALTLVEPAFHMGKTYLYGYESVIMHGLPDRGLATAGVRLTGKLEISRVSQSDHLLQIREPKLEEHNGFWPMDPFIPSLRLSETFATCLSQAFKFEYTEGRVGSIFAPEDCPILCTNLVRGILNMMQITIKKSQNVYELQEAGIEGICQTRYIIQDDSKSNWATISKSKDLMNCQEKAVKNMGMAYIRPCPTCSPKVRNIKGTVMFTYKMKYDDSGVSLMSATSEQVYQISPFNEPNAAAVMEARQELSLVGVRRTPISAPKTQLQNQGSLRYHFSGELLQMPIPLIRIKNPDLQLIETLRQLVQNNEKGDTKEASVKFLQMVQLFRVATLDQIESLWLQFVNELSYRPWFLSAICAAGATDTFRFLKQKIHDEKLNTWEAAATLPLAFHFVTPNKQTLEVASPLHDLATEATSKANAKDMSLALKAIGNAGEPASIKRILKFLPTFSSAAVSLPSRIHADAVLALRKIARKDPAKVREITLQVFMDNTLAPNVRMVACVVLFETKPALPTVTAMASSLLTEPSLQVTSFTYSHMKALAAGRIPQLYKLSSACNIAIKLLSPRLDRLSYRYSKVIHVGGYSSEYQAGAIWRFYLMNSPSTMFPSDIITKVRGYYANTAMDIIEMALRSQSLAKLIRKQNIPFAEYDAYKTLKKLGKTFLGWKELPPEDPLVSAYIKVLGQEIAFVDIDKDAIQQIMMHLTGSSDWQPVVKKVVEEVQRGISGRWTLPAMVGELRHIVPTVVGVPLELGLCGATVAHTAADVDIQMSPPLSDNFRPTQLLETKMDIHGDIRPKAYFHMIAMMGINTQYFQSGLEFHVEFSANTTMKFDARINMKEKNLKIETLPCHQEADLAAVRKEIPKKNPSFSRKEKYQESLTSHFSHEKDLPDLVAGRNTYLHKLVGELEAKITLKPVHTDADIDKIELEIQAGSKAASKIIDVASSGSKEEEEISPYEDTKAKLKKILGIENVFTVSLPVYQFRFKSADEQDQGREILNSSISSSSSSAASDEGISTAMSQGSLKWGKDCQDYQIAAQIATGQFAAYPAMQMKLEWLTVPSIVRTTARWFYSFLPGAAYVLGYSLRQQLGPSHQATLVMALTSPRTFDVVFKLPEVSQSFRSPPTQGVCKGQEPDVFQIVLPITVLVLSDEDFLQGDAEEQDVSVLKVEQDFDLNNSVCLKDVVAPSNDCSSVGSWDENKIISNEDNCMKYSEEKWLAEDLCNTSNSALSDGCDAGPQKCVQHCTLPTLPCKTEINETSGGKECDGGFQKTPPLLSSAGSEVRDNTRPLMLPVVPQKEEELVSVAGVLCDGGPEEQPEIHREMEAVAEMEGPDSSKNGDTEAANGKISKFEDETQSSLLERGIEEEQKFTYNCSDPFLNGFSPTSEELPKDVGKPENHLKLHKKITKLQKARKNRINARKRRQRGSEEGKSETKKREHKYDKFFIKIERDLTPLGVPVSFSCRMCFFASSNPRSFIHHMKGHKERPPYQCPQCEYSCSTFSCLLTHMYWHAGYKLYQCRFCSFFSLYFASMVRHSSIHTEAKPYSWEFCQSAFSSSLELQRHGRLHAGTKMCQGQELNCVRGRKRTRRSLKNYSCDECNLVFYTKGDLSLHKKFHEPLEANGYTDQSNKYYKICKAEDDSQGHVSLLGRENYGLSGAMLASEVDCKQAGDVQGNKKMCSRKKFPENSLGSNSLAITGNRSEVTQTSRQMDTVLYEEEPLLKSEASHLQVQDDDDAYHNFVENPKDSCSTLNTFRTYMCQHCSYATDVQNNFRLHLKIHTDERPFVCKDCNKTFKTSNHLEKHSLFHVKNEQELGSCLYVEKCLENLQLHREMHGGTCPERDFGFSEGSNSSLLGSKVFGVQSYVQRGSKNYLLAQSQPPFYQCAECKYTTYSLSNLELHIRTHTGEKPYSCTVCQMKFRTSSHLRRHRVTHLNREHFKCKNCDYSTHQWLALKRHLASHSGEGSSSPGCLYDHEELPVKTYRCEECGYCTAHNGNLKLHLRIHSGERPFKCRQCGLAFRTSSHLKRHLLTHLRLRCRRCKYSTLDKRAFQKHVKTHRKKQTCGKCNVALPTRKLLEKHKRQHEAGM
ncbi:hypothetical protein BTVI_108389 [Pitangus sulphuratus]|nr:hypothetical protein BTVI_108389 [Pitangus sulphuratus]